MLSIKAHFISCFIRREIPQAVLSLWMQMTRGIRASGFKFPWTLLRGNPLSVRERGDSGFTLLEVIVAMTIMAIGFVAVVELFSGGIRSATLSERYLKGTTLASDKLSELDLGSFDTGSGSGIFKDAPDYRWELEVSPYPTLLNDEEFDVRVAKINIKVLWNDSGNERNVELVTLKMMGETFPATDEMIQGINTTASPSISQTKVLEDNPVPIGKSLLP